MWKLGTQRQSGSQDPSEEERSAFPSDDPKKRIDLILYRGDPGVTVSDVAVVGQDAESVPQTTGTACWTGTVLCGRLIIRVVAEFRLEG